MRATVHTGNMLIPFFCFWKQGKDIVYAPRNWGLRDERTGVNGPLVYQLCRQVDRWVAMSGTDKR